LIPKDQIKKVLSTADIVDVIGERIDIKRAGSNYKARCPFHDEKTPSFMISASKQIFKCFGCSASGDAIKFLMMYDSLSYPDAIRHLASKYGIELTETNERSKDQTGDDKKELLRILNKIAADIFYERLIREYSYENSPVIKYLSGRGIEKEYINKFRLGYAPDEWNFLSSDKRLKDYKDEILIEAGLRKKNEKGNVYDQFRNRLMFPVFDQLGNTVGFSGRTLNDDIQPKYLNSPESEIYKKNQVLYGLFQAMESVRKKKEIILVEGNVDLISMHKFGFENTAAICGTAFTENHANLIKRNAEKVTVLLDGDDPGRKSALRTSEILISCNIIPMIVILPEEDDPDSYLKKNGAAQLTVLLNQPVNIIDLCILLNDNGNINDPNQKVTAAKEVINILKNIKDGITLDLFTKEASKKLGIDLSVIKKELTGSSHDRNKNIKPVNLRRDEYICKNDDIVEFSIIYLMITDETLRKKFLAGMNEEDFENEEASGMFNRIYELYEEGEEIKLNNILFDFNEKFKDFMIGFVLKQDSAFFSSAGFSENETQQRVKLDKAFEDNFSKIVLRKLKKRIDILNGELKFTNDQNRQNEILKELTEVKRLQKQHN